MLYEKNKVITPSDKEYKIAKKILKGEKTIPYPYSTLAEWIQSKYSVKVLNVSYCKIEPDNRPRLSIDLETEADRKVFEQSRYSFDSKKSTTVIKKFKEIASDVSLKISLDNIFIVFSAFEPIAKEEANENVPEKLANKLIHKFAQENIWSIQKLFSSLIVFYYTEAEREEAVNKGMVSKFKNYYSKIIEPYDEFGYLASNPIIPGIDSKENFDKNYQSSWFYYWR